MAILAELKEEGLIVIEDAQGKFVWTVDDKVIAL